MLAGSKGPVSLDFTQFDNDLVSGTANSVHFSYLRGGCASFSIDGSSSRKGGLASPFIGYLNEHEPNNPISTVSLRASINDYKDEKAAEEH